jgi:hypothetical protein
MPCQQYPVYTWANTGTLLAGKYFVQFANYINGYGYNSETSSTGNFALTPTRHNVPDGGSTIMLLGGALSIIGIIRRRLS